MGKIEDILESKESNAEKATKLLNLQNTKIDEVVKSKLENQSKKYETQLSKAKESLDKEVVSNKELKQKSIEAQLSLFDVEDEQKEVIKSLLEKGTTIEDIKKIVKPKTDSEKAEQRIESAIEETETKAKAKETKEKKEDKESNDDNEEELSASSSLS